MQKCTKWKVNMEFSKNVKNIVKDFDNLEIIRYKKT